MVNALETAQARYRDAIAIESQNCGSCAHSNDDDTVVPDLHTYCTNANSFYRARSMEKSTKCAKYEARS